MGSVAIKAADEWLKTDRGAATLHNLGGPQMRSLAVRAFGDGFEAGKDVAAIHVAQLAGRVGELLELRELEMGRVETATKEWQGAHQTTDLPDLGKLIDWLRAERDIRVRFSDVMELVAVIWFQSRDTAACDMQAIAGDESLSPEVRKLAQRVATAITGSDVPAKQAS